MASLKCSWVFQIRLLTLLILSHFPCSTIAGSYYNANFPSANAPMYWKNDDSHESFWLSDGSIFKPILGVYNKSRSCHAFGLGFFTNISSSTSISTASSISPSSPISTLTSSPISAPTSAFAPNPFLYYLVVYMLQVSSSNDTVRDDEFWYDYTSSLIILWSANRDKPVGVDATLDFTSQGELLLKDADGAPVWSTNATNTNSGSGSGSDRHNNYSVNAIRMEITVGGNLMLLNGRNSVVWQSFDQPTDTWLPNQRLHIGQGLTARISPSNLSTGIYHLSLTEDRRLIAFLQHSSSTRTQEYAELNYEESYRVFPWGIETGMEHSKIYAQFTVITPTARSFQYIVLEPNGHLTTYQVDDRERSGDDILANLGDSYETCIYPEACGRYGVCGAGGHCICPDQNGTLSYFKQFDADIGCEPTNPLSCKGNHSFVELPNVTYFDVQPSFSHLIDAEKCRDECAKNCSCKAAFFQHQGNKASGNCSLQTDELYSFISYKEESHTRHLAFVKVQDVSVQEKTQSDHRKKHASRLVPVVLVPSLFGGLVFAIFVAGICYGFRMLKNTDQDAEKEGDDEVTEALTKFSFEELKTYTQNFQIKLGQGGFGSVFEGVLCNGTKVAVKRLDSIGQGRKEFLAEVNIIGKVDHFNLVKLIGYCAEKSNRLLVYEHMCNGSLDKWIFNQDRAATLSWEIRQKIIRGIAKGLEYLHEECSKKIIHFDIKPQNILLDIDFNPKISDFGLAKLIDRNQSLVLSALKGTPGYLAPELLGGSNVSVKVDVYSFGIVILETMCGRRNLDMSKSEPLVHILKIEVKNDQLCDFIDQRNEDFLCHREEAVKMIKLGLWCLQTHDRRPSMSMVVKGLENSNMEIITNPHSLTIIPIDNSMHVMNPYLSTAPEASILSRPR